MLFENTFNIIYNIVSRVSEYYIVYVIFATSDWFIYLFIPHRILILITCPKFENSLFLYGELSFRSFKF